MLGSLPYFLLKRMNLHIIIDMKMLAYMFNIFFSPMVPRTIYGCHRYSMFKYIDGHCVSPKHDLCVCRYIEDFLPCHGGK